MEATVVRAGSEHLDDLVPLFNAYREFYQQAPDLEAARRFLGDRLREQDSMIFLALQPGDERDIAVGFAQLYPSFSSVAMKRIWILNDLFVAPSFRRAGVAKQLMAAARDLAMATGAARLTLATARDNLRAKALYESHGYQTDQVFDHYHLCL